MKIRKNSRSKQGTILVEALISVAILSVSIVIVLQSLTAASRASSRAETYIEASNILENNSSVFILSPQILVDGKEVPIKGNLHDYIFQLSRGNKLFEENDDLQSILLTVTWGNGQTKNDISSQTLYYAKTQ
ncbi:MAG: hypothetical protein HQL26_09560 [Candidatus Omnitrophica bacterium]|nr:hypothetical protein [Candidatus Omnitrophota bacterium]